MGYGYYTVGADDRPAGYMVGATCDRRGCDVQIDRGLGWLCGDEPHDRWDGDPGCGRYYCSEHLGTVGARGGCNHPQSGRAWGVVLSCMTPNADGSIVCLDRTGHETPHAWDAL